MNSLHDFYAAGVTFPEANRADLNMLTARIPDDGTLHVAILNQPYFDLVNDGAKTIESRFNTKRAAPYGRVAVGDLVLLKLPGQAITNYFFAASARYVDLTRVSIDAVRAEFAARICAEPEDEFWQSKADSHYCTLIGIGERGSVQPLPMSKRDQRGWVSFARVLL